MAYCTIDDIRDRIDEDTLIQLTDDDDTGAVVDSIVDEAIADASAEIDASCSGRFGVPLDPVPRVIVKWCKVMVVYALHQRRNGASEEIRKEYEDALKFLALVREGKVDLGIHPEPEPPDEENIGSDGPIVDTRDKTYSDELWEKY